MTVDAAAQRDKFAMRIILILSIVVSAAVAFLILGPRPEGVEGAMDVSALPTVNASLNGLTTLLLVVGLVLIKQKKPELKCKLLLQKKRLAILFFNMKHLQQN